MVTLLRSSTRHGANLRNQVTEAACGSSITTDDMRTSTRQCKKSSAPGRTSLRYRTTDGRRVVSSPHSQIWPKPEEDRKRVKATCGRDKPACACQIHNCRCTALRTKHALIDGVSFGLFENKPEPEDDRECVKDTREKENPACACKIHNCRCMVLFAKHALSGGDTPSTMGMNCYACQTRACLSFCMYVHDFLQFCVYRKCASVSQLTVIVSNCFCMCMINLPKTPVLVNGIALCQIDGGRAQMWIPNAAKIWHISWTLQAFCSPCKCSRESTQRRGGRCYIASQYASFMFLLIHATRKTTTICTSLCTIHMQVHGFAPGSFVFHIVQKSWRESPKWPPTAATLWHIPWFIPTDYSE